MIEQEFVMLIMNCKKYTWKADIQRNSWLKLVPEYIKYYHVIGDEELDSEYKFDNENKILYVNTPDDYNSLPNKVITSYKAIHDTFNFKYIFKTDDDQKLINVNFLVTLHKLLKKTFKFTYGGHIVNNTIPYLSEYYRIHPELPKDLPILVTKYCSGRFYFLSTNSVKCLLSKRESIIKEFLEDYAIGYHLHDYFKINMLSLNTDINFIDDPLLEKVEQKV